MRRKIWKSGMRNAPSSVGILRMHRSLHAAGMLLIRPLVAYLALLGLSHAVADTLADAIDSAVRNNPLIHDARLAIRSAKEDKAQARSAYLPQIRLNADIARTRSVQRQGGFDGDMSRRVTWQQPASTSIEAAQSIYAGGRRSAQQDLAASSIRSAQSGFRSTEQELVYEVVQAYVSVRRDAEILRLREAYVQGLERQEDGARKRLAAGEITRTDQEQVKARIAGGRANRAGAQANLDRSKAAYIELVGLEPTDLQPLPPPPAVPATLSEALVLAARQHPDLMLAKEAVAAAKAQKRLERSNLLPQIDIVARQDFREEQRFQDSRNDSASLVARFSMPLFEGGYGVSRLRRSSIDIERAEAKLEAQRRAVAADIARAWTALTASADILAQAGIQTEAAKMAWIGNERELGLGLRSTLDVLDAELEWRQAQIEQESAAGEAQIASYALMAAIGDLNANRLSANANDASSLRAQGAR